MKRVSNRQTRQNGGRIPRSVKPPTYDANTHFRHKFRFAASVTSPIEVSIDAQDLLQILESPIANYVATNPATFTNIFQCFRIAEVEIWQPYNETSSLTWGSLLPNSCGVYWNASLGGRGSGEQMMDMAVNYMSPGHVRSRPPKDSFQEFWTTSAAGTMFTLSFDRRAIIDVTLDLRFIDPSGNSALPGEGSLSSRTYVTQCTLFAAVPYYACLDVTNAATYTTSCALKPVGVQAIAHS
jgi:hypothetical protein